MVTGEGLKARRLAREIVAELRWCGMTVPPLYGRMADEFEDLVRSGDYAAWVPPEVPVAQGRTAPDGGPHSEEGGGARHEARRREATSR